MRVLLVLALMVVAALPGALAEQRIEAGSLAFAPARALVAEWESVRWSWAANETHGVVSSETGEVWCPVAQHGCVHYFRREGDFAYHCPLHPEMRGGVVVERRGGDPGSPLHASFFVHLQGLTVTLDASPVAQSRTAIESYEWDFGDNTTGSGRLVEHGYARAGTYVVRLTVVDEFGNEDTGARFVTVRLLGDPEASFRANATGRAVLFEADPLEGSHTWDFGDGSRLTCSDGCSPGNETVVTTPTSVLHVYRRGGTFLVNHTAGPFWAASLVSVRGEETFEIVPTGLEVEVDASALPRYGNATVSWLFGDLDRAQGERARHTFPKAGLWSIDLTLVDEAGSMAIEREALLAPLDRPEERIVAAAVEPAGNAAREAPTPAAFLALLALAVVALSRSERYK